MEKTAMQIAIDWMLSDSFKVENLTRFDVAKKLIELKEVEKNNNRNLFIDGFLHGMIDNTPRLDEEIVEIYNNKYGTNESI